MNVIKIKLLLLSVIFSTMTFLIAFPLQSQAESKNKIKKEASTKERLVLMPLRVPDEDKNLTGAMQTALVKGLQQKYDVYSGEQVSQKAHEIFMKESRNTARKECDETKCMQNIAMAFQAELIATANVTKQSGSYFLALIIQNIFDNKVVYSESIPCRGCDAAEVVEKLKLLSVSNEAQGSENKLFLDPQNQIITPNTSSTVTIENDLRELIQKAQDGDVVSQYEVALKYNFGIGVNLDYNKAFEWYEKFASKGNAQSQFGLSLCYANGWGTTVNVVKAYQHLQLSASKGVPQAEFMLSLYYFDGLSNKSITLKKDLSESSRLYDKSFQSIQNLAQQGDIISQSLLSEFYKGKLGSNVDTEKSLFWAEKAAAQGSAFFEYELGNKLYLGNNFDKAKEWYEKAANQGFIEAMASLGAIFYNSDNKESNPYKAFEWYEKAAKLGNGRAQYVLGLMYENGKGVNKNIGMALDWYDKATQNNIDALSLQILCSNATSTSHDATGVEKKIRLRYQQRAFNWCEKSAEQGDKHAISSLARMYFETKSYSKAFEIYEKLAMQGDNNASFYLGEMYYDGNGVKKDLVLSYAWFNLAASNGIDTAASFLDLIKLNPKQQKLAERLSANWTLGNTIRR
jgi:TPR repeat protein